MGWKLCKMAAEVRISAMPCPEAAPTCTAKPPAVPLRAVTAGSRYWLLHDAKLPPCTVALQAQGSGVQGGMRRGEDAGLARFAEAERNSCLYGRSMADPE